ncbi:hypothetical protein QOZ80_5BG0456680 [Eleusine coracana subsp. coracana]|nr:hypothetical protein QOZ80_5BG0456680 [Eleusine coracana subsp. coracana]
MSKREDCLDEAKKPLLLSRYYARLSALVEENTNRPPPVVNKEEEKEEEGEECPGLEPLFFDEAEEAVANDHERHKCREHEEEQRQKAHANAEDRIYNNNYDPIHFVYDPKLGRINYTRIHFVDLNTFDLDEESPLGPMRDTEAPIHVLHGTVCKEGSANSAGASQGRFVPCNSVNVFSVKIVSSDVGFPINVYGTVIARDSLDLKCVYLFDRHRDDCQLILSKDESLILTGPKARTCSSSCCIF